MSSAAPARTGADVRRLADSAYDEVKHRILLNVYPAGFQILEEALCDELGMSRTPLREVRIPVDETGNVRLAAAARTLLDQSQRFRMFSLRMRDKPVRSTRSHELLVAALRCHDTAKAIAEHSAHKANWHKQMAELMQKFGIRHI